MELNCPTWNEFLRSVLGGDAEVQEFQKMIGSELPGSLSIPRAVLTCPECKKEQRIDKGLGDRFTKATAMTMLFGDKQVHHCVGCGAEFQYRLIVTQVQGDEMEKDTSPATLEFTTDQRLKILEIAATLIGPSVKEPYRMRYLDRYNSDLTQYLLTGSFPPEALSKPQRTDLQGQSDQPCPEKDRESC